MVYYNPFFSLVVFHPLYNPTNQGPFFHCSTQNGSLDVPMDVVVVSILFLPKGCPSGWKPWMDQTFDQDQWVNFTHPKE